MTRQPLEFYTVNTAMTVDWPDVLNKQHCPLLVRKCVKQRKSNPEQTIGSCILSYQQQPLIVCPFRFLEDNQIFLDAMSLLRVEQAEYYVVSEIAMPGGSIDYFLVALHDGSIVDFAGIEIQALDTTGSGAIWQARTDLLNNQFASSYN